MKKTLKVIAIFAFMNILTLVLWFIFWKFLLSSFLASPYLNWLTSIGIYLFLIFVNIYLINSYIKEFTKRKILIISSLVITVLFAIYSNMNAEKYDMWDNSNRYEEKIKLINSDEMILFHKYLPTFQVLELETDEYLDTTLKQNVEKIEWDFLYWSTIDKFWYEESYKTNLENWKTYSKN